MKNKKLKYSLAFIGAIIIILFVVFKQMNKEHVDVKKTTPNLIIAVDEILSDFENDEEKANTKFTDKIIELKGVIAEITTQDNATTITLMSQNFDATVICSLLPEETPNVLEYKKGDEISLKGICKGYLLDVVIVNCIIIN